MNRKQIICLSIFVIISVIVPALADNTSGTVMPNNTETPMPPVKTAYPTNTVTPINTATQTNTVITNTETPMPPVITPINTATPTNTVITNTETPMPPVITSFGTPTGTTGNAAATTVIPTTTPISEEEKTKVTNIAINLTVNIGIVNPKVVDVTREEENVRVRVKDSDTGEIIVVIITPQEEATANVPKPVFTEVENNFSGQHVSFQFTKNRITQFTVNGVLIFQSIDLGFTSTNFKTIGTEFRIFNDKNMVIIHDNDNGIITEKSSENIEEIFQTTSDIKVTGNGQRVDLSEKIKGSIVGNNVVSTVSGNTVNVKVNQGESTFVTSTTTTDLFQGRVIDGIVQQQIGSVVNIESENVHDISTFNVDTSVDQVTTNTVSVSVNSAINQGKVIALRVNKDILQDLNLKVLVDGNEINKAIDFDDLFKVDKLAFLLVIGQDIEIFVSVPHFSEHKITVTSAAPISTQTSTVIATSTIPTVTIPAETTPAPTKTPGFTSDLILAVMVILYIKMKRK